MTEQGAVPMIVLTRSQDHVEAINSTLRKAGHPVHCTWLPDASDLGDALTQINPEMLIAFIEELGVEVPVDQMFLNPTVASISAYIESLDAVPNSVSRD